MSEDRFYIKDLQLIRDFCLNSEKEDIYKYIYSLQQENQLLKIQVSSREEVANKYKDVIDEVREHIEETCYYPEAKNYSSMTADEVKELLQILDKVKGEKNENN